MLQTTTKRPPSLTLTGARIFKQRLATTRKHRIGSQESGVRSQEPESSEQNMKNMTFRHSLRQFYCYCMLIKILEFQIYWQPYSDRDYK